MRHKRPAPGPALQAGPGLFDIPVDPPIPLEAGWHVLAVTRSGELAVRQSTPEQRAQHMSRATLLDLRREMWAGTTPETVQAVVDAEARYTKTLWLQRTGNDSDT